MHPRTSSCMSSGPSLVQVELHVRACCSHSPVPLLPGPLSHKSYKSQRSLATKSLRRYNNFTRHVNNKKCISSSHQNIGSLLSSPKQKQNHSLYIFGVQQYISKQDKCSPIYCSGSSLCSMSVIHFHQQLYIQPFGFHPSKDFPYSLEPLYFAVGGKTCRSARATSNWCKKPGARRKEENCFTIQVHFFQMASPKT